jgi:hypothetical protein
MTFFANKKPAAGAQTLAQKAATGAPPPPPVQAAMTPEQQHAMLAMQAFGGGRMTKAVVTERGNNEKPGHYVERIEKMFLHASTQKMGVIFCIVEKTIFYVVAAQGTHPTSNVRETVSTRYDLSKPAALGSLKGFLAKILDIPVDEVDPNGDGGMARVVTAPDQPLAGTVIECNKNLGKTQEKKQDFLYVNAIRRVPAADLKDLPAETLAWAFPGDTLDRMIAAEAEAMTEQAAPA